MVGCDAAVFARVQPVIATWAAKITQIGPVGSGHKMKLLMNFIGLFSAALYSEALTLGSSGRLFRSTSACGQTGTGCPTG